MYLFIYLSRLVHSTTSKEHGHHDIVHVTPRFVCFEYFIARFALTTSLDLLIASAGLLWVGTNDNGV